MGFLQIITLSTALSGGSSAIIEPPDPVVEENWQTYTIDGVTDNDILQQLQALGPNGYWAYTSWYVEWTGSCEVTVTIDYIMPEHSNADAMEDDLRLRWDAMIEALRKHEEQHGRHGLNAANEVVENNCSNANAIIDRWAEQDRIFDRETSHGYADGVVFP